MAVGSDHINSYLIMRAIREETGLKDGEITDSMIDEWVTVRSMLSSRLLGGIPMVMTSLRCSMTSRNLT